MFISPAFAQSATGGTGGLLELLFPIILVFAIIYFFIIRPQQKRQKDHQTMLAALRRGDTIVTQGGLIGKIAKVEDNEIQLDIADDTRVTIIKSMVLSVHVKGTPAKDTSVKGTSAKDASGKEQ